MTFVYWPREYLFPLPRDLQPVHRVFDFLSAAQGCDLLAIGAQRHSEAGEEACFVEKKRAAPQFYRVAVLSRNSVLREVAMPGFSGFASVMNVFSPPS
jgi:hypothetical protein